MLDILPSRGARPIRRSQAIDAGHMADMSKAESSVVYGTITDFEVRTLGLGLSIF